ncbi:MAG TPA: cytidine deaminase [Trebonia sp.]
MNIDWPQLRAAAVDVAGRAYAPYSRLRVGAAGLTADGQVVVGCNVENASFGVTLCAECGLVSALHATPPRPPRPPRSTDGDSPGSGSGSGSGPGLVAVAVVAGDGDPLLPCGRCRQLLLEAGGPTLLVDTDAGPVPLAELLPAAFGGADLSARRAADERAPS